MKTTIRRFIAVLGGLAAALVFAAVAVCDVLVVRGTSMESTLKSGDRVVVLRSDVLSRLPRVWRALLKKGRIVVFRSPIRSDELFIKRIVAIEGDSVRIDHSTLIVNERVAPVPATVVPLDSSWPPMRNGQLARTVEIPAGNYFVLSDNRLQQLDSRTLGPITPNMIVGIVVGVLSHESKPASVQTAAATSPPLPLR